jgi:heptosyltransferase-2/heptosyltransferase-3
VAPLLSGFEQIDNVITIDRNSMTSRARIARALRAAHYDVAYNLHGGTTATFLVRASGAKHRVGYASYQYARLHNQLAPPPQTLWGRKQTHSVEQQLALLGWTGVPVTDRPATQLGITSEASAAIEVRLSQIGLDPGSAFALVHPAAAFATKQWAVEKFAKIIEELAERGIPSVALVTAKEATLGEQLKHQCSVPVTIFDDLSLPEVTALSSRASIFVGNDSGIAHIAAAVGVPSVVIFGSSNRAHWQPWAKAPAEIVFEELPCQPCHGYFCEKFDQPECIIRVPVEKVSAAIDRTLKNSQ